VDTRRLAVLLISFNFALLAILGGFVYQKHLEITQLYSERDRAEQAAIERLVEHVREIDLVLRKGVYATSPEVFTALGTQLSETAILAGAALYGRPFLEALAQVEDELAGSVAVFGPLEEPSAVITVEAARSAVAAFMDLSESIFRHMDDLAFLARVDGGDLIAEVCGTSGRIMRIGNSREVPRTVLTVEESLDKMEAFLARNGYADMALRHWRREANQIAANFVPRQDGVLIYPNTVQISIGLDNGRVTGFSAAPTGGEERELPGPAVTRETALLAIPALLTVEDYDMVLLPVASGQEILCFAFLTRAADGQTYLIYVNAETGRQQEIRLHICQSNGK